MMANVTGIRRTNQPVWTAGIFLNRNGKKIAANKGKKIKETSSKVIPLSSEKIQYTVKYSISMKGIAFDNPRHIVPIPRH